jgi:hypothetical protein
MKNKLLAVMAVFGMVASASAVKINNNLSISGFIDGSYELIEAGTTGQDNQQEFGLDEVEINFNINVGNVSGLIAVDTDAAADEDADGSSDTLFNIEQAHITYNLNDAVSLTFGRYGSALGFEREDPAGLYTYSRAYGGSNGNSFNAGNIDNGNVVEGLTVAYSSDVYTLAASFEEAVGGFSDSEDLNLELSFTYTGIAGVNIGGGYFFDNREDGANEQDAANLHVSRQFGKLLLAGEYTQLDHSTNGEADGYLLLADYDVNDKLGFAVRFSNNENGAGNPDFEQFTIAPNYQITDSLGAILEYTDFEGDNSVGATNTDGEIYAVELTYTF